AGREDDCRRAHPAKRRGDVPIARRAGPPVAALSREDDRRPVGHAREAIPGAAPAGKSQAPAVEPFLYALSSATGPAACVRFVWLREDFMYRHSSSAAFLELFAAPAGAWLVPPDLLAGNGRVLRGPTHH